MDDYVGLTAHRLIFEPAAAPYNSSKATRRQRCISIPIVDDALVEGMERFFVTLQSDPMMPGNILIGQNSTASVTISDNDAPSISIHLNIILILVQYYLGAIFKNYILHMSWATRFSLTLMFGVVVSPSQESRAPLRALEPLLPSLTHPVRSFSFLSCDANSYCVSVHLYFYTHTHMHARTRLKGSGPVLFEGLPRRYQEFQFKIEGVVGDGSKMLLATRRMRLGRH